MYTLFDTMRLIPVVCALSVVARVQAFTPPTAMNAKTAASLVAMRVPSVTIKSAMDSKETSLSEDTAESKAVQDSTGKHHSHDDAFILKDVESIMVESPDDATRGDRTSKRRPLFGNATSIENKLDISADPLVNELRVMREMVKSCPEIWTYMNGEQLFIVSICICILSLLIFLLIPFVLFLMGGY